jgi:hypothetical protein
MTFTASPVVVWIVTIGTMFLSLAWLGYDSRNLWRLRRADRLDPRVRDQQFGYIIGVITAVVGIVGVLRYHF